MDIFKLRQKIINDYSNFLKSFLKIQDDEIEKFVSDELSKGKLYPESILQLNPAYKFGASIDELCQEEVLHPLCSDFFNLNNPLYLHQEKAIRTSQKSENYILTTGTGSGKSLTYLLPIFDKILKTNPENKSVRAIIVYPMNALINSQFDALERFRNERNFPVTYAKYTGQTKQDLRQQLREDTPHIIMTNYVMLELMLLRPKESVFVDAFLSDIEFLVVDELHIYRGRQGSDIAYLMRRIRERTGSKKMLCIGTSATMAAGESLMEKQEAVAQVARKLFGVDFKNENVIDETLVRKTNNRNYSKELLKAEINNPLDIELDTSSFINSPIASWIEDHFGLEEKEGKLIRRKPQPLVNGVEVLADITDEEKLKVESVIKHYLDIGSNLVTSDGSTIFPFKIHQFFSQGGSVYSTLENKNKRHLTLDGQVYYEQQNEKKYLYPMSFCRECGQEYFLVDYKVSNSEFIPRSSFYSSDETYENEGYLMLDEDGIWDNSLEENLPDNWFTPNRKNIKKDFRDYVPKEFHIDPQGTIVNNGEGVKVWFLNAPFLTCLRCGSVYAKNVKNDFRKLSKLSSEGRSSATSVLSISALEEMYNDSTLDESARKILSFTDNRQDASLQSGHFNDFMQVAILRAAIYEALKSCETLDYTNVASKTFQYLNLPLSDYSEINLLDEQKIKNVNETLTELLEYRIYEDLRRGWRVNQPNLEQCGLLRVRYDGMERICSDDRKWSTLTLMKELSPERREFVLHSFLNHLRSYLAIDANVFDDQKQQVLKKRVTEHINEKWGFDENEYLRESNRFIISSSIPFKKNRDQSLRSTSALGRFLRSDKNWISLNTKMTQSEYEDFLDEFLRLMEGFGFVVRRNDGKREYVQLRSSSIVWSIGDGNPPPPDPIRSNYFETRYSHEVLRESNTFFTKFYSEIASTLKLLLSKEHTGQIASWKRGPIEDKFREGKISSLFCSPTMELGIDIADLSVVHMRNIPPNPASYAQRSGRAGRSGQPSLVLSYSGYGNAHDQYFYKRPHLMVAGNVIPQKFDITNEELVKAHLHSVWLAKTGVDLGNSMIEVLDVINLRENIPIKDDILTQINLNDNKIQNCLKSFQSVIKDSYDELLKTPWFSDDWLEAVIRNSAKEFDTAFDRWREMYVIAVRQRTEARNELDNAPLIGLDKKKVYAAERREIEAKRQINLLLNKTNDFSESDFYPYRYLASEGFLPGYNFPKLPIRAFVRVKKGDGEYISRPRFLAINEYGPRNVIYHEGKKHRVVKSYLPTGSAEERFIKAKVCIPCGYIHVGDIDQINVCENCNTELNGKTSLGLPKLFQMSNVSTIPVEKITSDEEERLREGFDITTHYHFPSDSKFVKRINASVISDTGEALFNLAHNSSAQIFKINHGFKRSESGGFVLDTSNGNWAKKDDLDTTESLDESSNNIIGAVKIVVDDTKNMILVHPQQKELFNEELLASFESAFFRGIQEYFQIEESELTSGRIGLEENRRLLFYEVSEGGLGILSRIVEEPNVISEVAKCALDTMHFTQDAEGNLIDNKNECVQACYECLLSYSNQRDHKILNRHLVAKLFANIINSKTLKGAATRDYEQHYLYLKKITDSRSELERKFLTHLYKTKRRLPDFAQENLEDYYTCPDFYYKAGRVCVYCDGSVHDSEEQKARDEKIRNDIKQLGYRVITIRYDQDMESQISNNPGVFGDTND